MSQSHLRCVFKFDIYFDDNCLTVSSISQAPWPSSVSDIERLMKNESARCLRIRIWAIQVYEFHVIPFFKLVADYCVGFALVFSLSPHNTAGVSVA